jgi:hypothetical protein
LDINAFLKNTTNRARAILTCPAAGKADTADQKRKPTRAANPNTPRVKQGIPAAAQTRSHIHAEPTITLPGPTQAR